MSIVELMFLVVGLLLLLNLGITVFVNRKDKMYMDEHWQIKNTIKKE